MSYRLNIILSMTIDKSTRYSSIDEICDALKEAIGYSKEHESKDFELDIKLLSIDKTIE